MTKDMARQVAGSVPGWPYSTAVRPVRLGSYTYLPASTGPQATKGVLVKGGLPVALEATDEILQEFMESMSSLERDMSRRWVNTQTPFCSSAGK